MNLNFRPIEAKDIDLLSPFFSIRPNKTCDSVFLDSYLWRNYYHVQFAVSDEKAVQWLMLMDGKHHSAMPMCKEEDLPHYFYEMVHYFNEELREPFKIYLADEEAILALNLDPEKYLVTEQEDLKDYLYDGNAVQE